MQEGWTRGSSPRVTTEQGSGMQEKSPNPTDGRPGINDDIGEELRLRLYRMQF